MSLAGFGASSSEKDEPLAEEAAAAELVEVDAPSVSGFLFLGILKDARPGAQCYKTFYEHNLLMLIII
jgi:hypothetical protein